MSHDRAGRVDLTDAPTIIQGGMGVAVSNWELARSVSQHGQLGVVSGTAIAVVVARRLQAGDPGGHVRRALEALPLPGVGERIVERYYRPGGIPEGMPYKAVPAFNPNPRRPLVELTVAANFVEAYLAKEGHDGWVGVNHLHKLRLPTPSSLYGNVLAGVDVVAMGAGIPRDIPGMLDQLSRHEPVDLPVDVPPDEHGEREYMRFDPAELWDGVAPPPLRRPAFLAIIASTTLATALARDEASRPDGFVVEAPVAGGHNAPPRGKLQLDERNQPVYGPRDEVDLDAVGALGLPFWLAGGRAGEGAVAAARELGAVGVQVGKAFSLCRESGIDDELKARQVAKVRDGTAEVRTDALASPTGFPFKIAEIEGTSSDQDVYAQRGRICDLGFLTTPYRRDDGGVGMRCPSEPVDDYVRKGGDIAETLGRMCLCNGLMATIGLGQRRSGGEEEPPIVTSGDDLAFVASLIERYGEDYRAADVIEVLLSERPVVAAGRG